MTRHIWSQWIAPVLLATATGAALGLVCVAAWEGWWLP